MKQTRVIGVIAAMAFVLAGFSTRLHADDVATIEALCSAPWEVAGVEMHEYNETNGDKRTLAMPWSRVRIFQTDGTFTTDGVDRETGTWAISGNSVVLSFANGDKHTDTISLPLNPKGTPGTDARGNLTDAVQLPPPPPTATPEIARQAADLVGACQGDLALVSGTEGAGSGFIAVIGKSNYLITTTHIVAGIRNATFKTIGNTAIPAGAASVAVGSDVFCMAAPAGGKPLEIMQDVEKNAAVGDDVAVLANKEGEGVVNTFTGKIVSIGPDRIEVNAAFVPGYTGSPIIHLKTGKVIGLATCLVTEYDAVNHAKYLEPIIRRYGCRLDNIKSWQNVDWRAFYAQAAEMDKIALVTSELGIFFRDMEQTKGSIEAEQYTSPAMMDCFYHWQVDTSGKVNKQDLAMANRTLVSALKSASQADVTAARQRITYDFFLRELADQQKARDSMADGFKKLIDKYSE